MIVIELVNAAHRVAHAIAQNAAHDLIGCRSLVELPTSRAFINNHFASKRCVSNLNPAKICALC